MTCTAADLSVTLGVAFRATGQFFVAGLRKINAEQLGRASVYSRLSLSEQQTFFWRDKYWRGFMAHDTFEHCRLLWGALKRSGRL